MGTHCKRDSEPCDRIEHNIETLEGYILNQLDSIKETRLDADPLMEERLCKVGGEDDGRRPRPTDQHQGVHEDLAL